MTTTHIEDQGDFINGQWRAPARHDGVLRRENPCRIDALAFEAPFALDAIDEAVAAARAAQPAWDRLGLDARRELLLRFGQALDDRKEDIALDLAIETGKPLWEARTEAGALGAKVRIMCGTGAQYTQTRHLPDGSGLSRYRPLGVLVVLGPFNFPLHLPNGHIIPGLLTGNTIVFKPSELTSGCVRHYIAAAQAAGLPDGTLNVVRGAGDSGAKLAAHPQVHGVLFTGSYATGLRIKRATIEQHWKLLALEMGGKNTALVLEDANIEQAAAELMQAAFLSCGQRCSATSRVLARREIADELIDALRALTLRITTGDALREEVFMGPLINARARDAYLAAQREDEGGNLEPLLVGGVDREDLNGYFVKPALWRVRDADAPMGAHQREEIFGPDVVISVVEDDAQAVRLANATDYGLAMSVFSADEDRFESLSYALDAGILNLNRSTVGASSALPFGGLKKSGNHRPAAVLAGQYCAWPQAQLRQPSITPTPAPDAMPWRALRPTHE